MKKTFEEPLMSVTCIRNASWIVAWDAGEQAHVYLRDGDVAFEDDRVTHVGGAYQGAVDTEIDGAGMLVMPGLINAHTHPYGMPFYKSIREELANPKMYFTALYDGFRLFTPDPEDLVWGARYAYCEMLLSGATTCVDMSYPYPGWIDTTAASGIRVFVAPFYKSADWYTKTGHDLSYDWSDDGGSAAFEHAVGLMEQVESHACSTLHAMVAPMAVDNCTEELLTNSLNLARERGWPMQLHAGESMMEFLEMTRRTGSTPVQWLAERDLLDPTLTIGHGLFLDHHSWLHWYTNRDIGLLAEYGCTVSHCPTPFSRYGITLENFGRYLAAGVNMAIGTDCHPHNMLEEMRTAVIMARVAGEGMDTVTTRQSFNAATIGGAKALLRDDLGRLAPGSKADVVMVSVKEPIMRPVYDPLRALIYVAADRAVRHVFVEGKQVVDEGRVTTMDFAEIAEQVERIQSRVLDRVPERDYANRTAAEVTPLTLPLR